MTDDTTTRVDPQDLGRTHRIYSRARENVAKLEDRGRRALRDREAVDAELARAIDVDWGDMTLAQIATAANRIARLAGILRAAELLPRAKELEAGAKREYRRAREMAA